MMTREKMMEVLEDLADVSYEVDEDGFDVTLEDFGGFDENWSEIILDLKDPDAIDDFEDMLEKECISFEGDYYVTYHFDGFDVSYGCASFEI